jgi:hypothetical protein
MSSIYNYNNSTGVIVPDTSTILASVQTTYLDVFGADLVTTADTPQGVLITAEALAETAVVNNNAAIANQINPNIAGGTFLDAIMALTGIQRTPSTQTIVTGVTMSGVAGTVIPQGTLAATAAGDQFATQAQITLDLGGTGSVNFASVAFGAIPCAISALDVIVSNVLGWETVTNPVAGVLGSLTQSDQAARAYRNNTLAFQGVALPVAITSALYATPNVSNVTFLENYNSVPAGMIVSVTAGTLAGIYGMTTTAGTGTNGFITVGTDAINFASSSQTLPTPNPWPVALYTTSGNITLSGLSTQTGGNWSGSLTGGNIILVQSQTTASQNGVYLANSSSWTRQSYNLTSALIQPSISGISLLPNSVYACVNGGTNTDVAAALLENKSSGAAWNGGTSVTVMEPATGQNYTVLFDRPTSIPVVIKVTTTNGSTANIIQAVLNYAAGLVNGFAGFVVGANVSPFEISGAILTQYPSYFINKVEVSIETSISYSTNIIPIGTNQIATTQLSYITVVVV